MFSLVSCYFSLSQENKEYKFIFDSTIRFVLREKVCNYQKQYYGYNSHEIFFELKGHREIPEVPINNVKKSAILESNSVMLMLNV